MAKPYGVLQGRGKENVLKLMVSHGKYPPDWEKLLKKLPKGE